MIIHLILQGQDSIKVNDMRIAVEYLFEPQVIKEWVTAKDGRKYVVTGRHGMWKILDADKERYPYVAQYFKGRFFDFVFNGKKFRWSGKNVRKHPSVIIGDQIAPYFSLEEPPTHNWDKPRSKGNLWILDPKIPLLKFTDKSGWEVIR